MADKIGFTQEHKDLAKELYLEEMHDVYELTKVFGTSTATVHSWLRELNVGRRDRNRTTTVNHTAFDTITDESAYWCGVLATDGYVTAKGSNIGLTLIDEEVVANFLKFVGSDKEVKLFKGTNLTRNQAYSGLVTSKVIENALAKYGITKQKTLTLEVSDELALNPNFWRGAIDGDGSISWNSHSQSPVLSLCGTARFVRQFQTFLKTIDVESQVYDSRATLSECKLSVLETIKALDYFYLLSSTTTRMKRKYEYYCAARMVFVNKQTLKSRKWTSQNIKDIVKEGAFLEYFEQPQPESVTIIYQIDLLSNRIISEYQSAVDAAQILGVQVNSIYNCVGSSSQTSFNSRWVYKSDYESMKHLLAKPVSPKGGRRVNQIDISTGKIINTFPSASEAKRSLNIPNAKIIECCRGNRKVTAGFKWEYA